MHGGAQTPVAVRVILQDRVGKSAIDQVFRVERRTANDTSVGFDVPWGVYRLLVETRSKPSCGDVDYFQVLPEHDRELTATLRERFSAPVSQALITGTTPVSFAYIKPEFVVFDSQTSCNKPIGATLPEEVSTSLWQDAYYTTITPSHGPLPPGAIAAVRLEDSHGGFHYVRLPIHLPSRTQSWPEVWQFNIPDGVVDYVADKPEDTLLCPRIWETITG